MQRTIVDCPGLVYVQKIDAQVVWMGPVLVKNLGDGQGQLSVHFRVIAGPDSDDVIA